MGERGNGADSSYVIRTGADALGRLELIARLFWPSTELFLTRREAFCASRFLDVGCGLGDVACRVASRSGAATGIDVNADVVHAATQRAEQVGAPAVFRTAAAAALGTDAELRDFDVVYARCLLSHLSDPSGALASLFAAVKPGGMVLIEDVEVSAVWSSPPCEALARHVELYVAAAFGLSAHPDVGPKLAGLVRELGGTDVEVDLTQPVLRRPVDLQIHARTMEAIAGPVSAQGLATETEIADLITELDEWSATPGVVATLPRIVQVSARAP